MNIFETEIREQLLKAFEASPSPESVIPIIILWRFPHLEPLDVSWSFMKSIDISDGGLLRVASWNKFDYFDSLNQNYSDDCFYMDASIPDGAKGKNELTKLKKWRNKL